MVTTKQTNSLCPICLEENATDLVTLTCKHIVCRPCFLRLIFVPNAFTKCPMCRSVISLGKLFKKGKEFQRLSWITVYDQFRARSLWRPQIVLHATPKIYYTSELWNVMCTMLWLVIYLLYCIAEFLPMQKMYYCKLSFENWKYEIECDCLLLQKLNPDPEFRTLEYNKKIELKYLLVTKFVGRCKDRWQVVLKNS